MFVGARTCVFGAPEGAVEIPPHFLFPSFFLWAAKHRGGSNEVEGEGTNHIWVKSVGEEGKGGFFFIFFPTVDFLQI